MNDPLFPSPLLRRPWRANPWADPLFVGPPNRRPISGASPCDEKLRQRAAVNAWEDDGGSTAAAIGRSRP